MFTAALVPDDEAGLKSLVGSAPAKEVIEEGYEVGRGALARRCRRPRGARGRAAGPRRVPPGDARAAAGRAAALVPRLPEPPRAAGVLARARSAGGHGDAGEGHVGARGAAVDVARRRARGAGAAVPARLRAGHALPARVLGADRASHAKTLFDPVKDELAPAAVEGRRGFVLAADCHRLESPPAASGVRLLGGHDPYVAQPDRESLVPDAAVRKRSVPIGRAPGGRAGGRCPHRAVARPQAGRRLLEVCRRDGSESRSTSARRRRRSRGCVTLRAAGLG